jgi:hypothetical protein
MTDLTATERNALKVLAESGTELPAGGQSRKGKMVQKRAAESLTEKGLAYYRHLKGKQPGYVASVEGRRLVDE